MPYTYNTPEDERAMLQVIGATSVDELFQSIPEEFRLRRPLAIGPALGELELTQHIVRLTENNAHAGQKICFLGGGCYDHFIPAAVDALASRGEFYTSYTPYQPEVSQGNLQAIFEYQSLVCQLTGMEVANASLYDGGTATVEGVLMAIAATQRDRKVVVCRSAHPEYRQVIETYLRNLGTEVVTIEFENGVTTLGQLEAAVDAQTACVVVQHPNFFGAMEPVARIADLAHQKGALLVQAFDPTSLGILKNPGQLGADIAVAEGQCLGNPMAYGGPYLGILAAREAFIRRIPGRIAGQTVSDTGKRCWVLTLQTREQHIRRDKATSNICTNQGLFALRASIYLALLGPRGLRRLGELCARKAHYAARRLSSGGRLDLAFDAPYFKEFVIRDEDRKVESLLAAAEDEGFFAGIPLECWYPELADCFLVAVTEKRTRAEIDSLAKTLVGAPLKSEAVHA
jgi:glycine dehydrogenase subunit 1